MLTVRLTRQAQKTLTKAPKDQAKRLATQIQVLASDPEAPASIELRGLAPWRRIKSGDFRIVYQVAEDELLIGAIGKRNDDEIYRQVRRFLS